jgi:hypothetical protein
MDLFGSQGGTVPEPLGTGSDLRLHRSAGPRLSKAQQKFNRLAGRIEQLRRDLDRERAAWEERLLFCRTVLDPLRSQVAERQKAVVRLLAPYLDPKRLPKNSARKYLEALLADQLNGIIEVVGNLLDEDLRSLFQKINGVSVDQARDEAFDMMREDLEDMFDAAGVEVDLSGLKADMSPEEQAAQMAKLDAELRAQEEKAPPRRGRKPGKRQLEREARERAAEELREQNITNLYRQLAKLLHPDLEQDPVRRAEKEAAMKQLTEAHRNRDFHTLLRLELEWLARHQSDVERLSDQKLAVYNAVLREQVQELETEIEMVWEHPRFDPLRPYLKTGPFETVSPFDGNAERQRLEALLSGIDASVKALQGPAARREVDLILRDYKNGLEEQAGPGFR